MIGGTKSGAGPLQLSRRTDVRTSIITAWIAAFAAVMTVNVSSQDRSFKADASRPIVTAADYERWQTELTNWGRWGKDDEMGALNLITPAKRKAATSLVKEGITVSLASNASTQKDVDVPCPVEWAMTAASLAAATDRIGYPCIHGAGATHIDSFAH